MNILKVRWSDNFESRALNVGFGLLIGPQDEGLGLEDLRSAGVLPGVEVGLYVGVSDFVDSQHGDTWVSIYECFRAIVDAVRELGAIPILVTCHRRCLIDEKIRLARQFGVRFPQAVGWGLMEDELPFTEITP